MLRNLCSFIRCRVYALLCTLKKFYRNNKLHFILCISCAVCGLLIALSGTYSDKTESANFIVIVINGARSPLRSIFNILLFTTITYLVLVLTYLHFALFVLSYGGIIIASMHMLRTAFISVSADGFLGVIFLVFFILPVLIYNFYAVTVLLSKLYDYRGYCSSRKHFANLACIPKRLLNNILRLYAVGLIVAFSLWLMIYLLVLIIC